MKLYIDCTGGVSGDMILKGLIRLGGSAEAAQKMELPQECRQESGQKAGGGTAHHSHHSHRSHSEIRSLIERSSLDEKVKETALSIYRVIAQAEAKVHGSDEENVHFHEVGRPEAIRNIVGTAAALESLGIDEIFCSEIHDGTGTIICSHGEIPVPVPAVAAMMETCNYRFVSEEIETEMVTPSGLGILIGIGARPAEEMPPGKIVKTVVVKGGRDTGKEGMKISLIESEQ